MEYKRLLKVNIVAHQQIYSTAFGHRGETRPNQLVSKGLAYMYFYGYITVTVVQIPTMTKWLR